MSNSLMIKLRDKIKLTKEELEEVYTRNNPEYAYLCALYISEADIEIL